MNIMNKNQALEIDFDEIPPFLLKWFKDRISEGIRKPFSEIVTITPDVAKLMLLNNPDNRPLKHRKIAEIANDILNNRWKINGESIIIANTGELNDGQNRLQAIIRADKAVKTCVFFGAERDSRFTVDMGTARTTSDFLGMESVTHSTLAASVTKLYIMYIEGRYYDNSALVTKQAIRDAYHENREKIDDSIKAVASIRFTIKSGQTAMCCAYIILKEINEVACTEFFLKLISGEDLKGGNAILQLRSHLYEAGKTRLRSFEKLELILRYWNAWRKNQRVERNQPLRGMYPNKIEY